MMKWCCTWTFAVILWGLAGVATAKSVEWDPNGSGNWYGANRWKDGATLTDADTDIAVTVNGCTGTVTEADAALFAKVSSVTLTGTDSCLAVSNTTAQDLTTAATITGDGTLQKLGNGICALTYAVTTEAEGQKKDSRPITTCETVCWCFPVRRQMKCTSRR